MIVGAEEVQKADLGDDEAELETRVHVTFHATNLHALLRNTSMD